jgi:2-oxoglutarate ferredoxin oxidoreductase subunit alpha
LSDRKQVDDIVIKFVGDSGDGIQLAGNIFADTLAHMNLDLATFPDFPAEVRAPRNTTFGVSGFQIHFSNKKVLTPGDEYDVLVCFNPASLKVNLKNVKEGGIIILDSANFTPRSLQTAGYTSNPLEDNSLEKYNVIKVPVSEIILNINSDLDKRTAEKTKNMFFLGLLYNMFDFDLKHAINYINNKFKSKSQIIEANLNSLEAGYRYSENIENFTKFYLSKCELLPGKYRDIQGNIATAWGLMAAAEKAGLQLFVGSYPITPATDILSELAKHRDLGVKTFQAEDEIAGITSAIGASFAGALAVTTTSGPGLSLKVEALGLAVMTELPLVIVDVQRAGPSTGMPTKSEQTDLYLAMFGRNGEAPIPIISATSPIYCFYAAF